MATRAENRPISGKPVFWQGPATEKQHEWSRWIELFQATLMTKSSEMLEELTREDSAANPRKKELLGEVKEPIAEKKP